MDDDDKLCSSSFFLKDKTLKNDECNPCQVLFSTR